MVTGGSEAAVTIAGMGGLMPCMRYLREMMIQNSFQTMDKDRDGFVLEKEQEFNFEEYEHAALVALLYIVKLGGVCPQMPIT
jgi:3-oxoacyl-[acyl-carrier-protein] synthase II